MQEKGSSDNHQVNNLKVVIDFANFLGPDITFYEVSRKKEIISFLNRKIKSSDIDPDKRWITTWNHFLNLKNLQKLKDTAIVEFRELKIKNY